MPIQDRLSPLYVQECSLELGEKLLFDYAICNIFSIANLASNKAIFILLPEPLKTELPPLR